MASTLKSATTRVVDGVATTLLRQRQEVGNRVSEPFEVTAVGSFPGTNVREIVAVIAGEIPGLPVLPELPARGPGADMIGRTGALLGRLSSAFALTTTPTGWRIDSSVSGALPKAMRVAGAWLGEDLDAFEERFRDLDGPVKVQLAGPFTMASSIELVSGERLLADAGAVRELVAATEMAAAEIVANIQRRVPGAQVWCQFDEPLLDRVVSGQIRRVATRSTIDVPDHVVTRGLAALADIEQAVAVGVHSCASRPPIHQLSEAGFDFISCDLTVIADRREEVRRALESQLAQYVEAGGQLIAGVDAEADQLRTRIGALEQWASRTGIDLTGVASQVKLTSPCGLAGVGSLHNVQVVFERLREAQRALAGRVVDQAK